MRLTFSQIQRQLQPDSQKASGKNIKYLRDVESQFRCAVGDSDFDGLSDLDEIFYKTNPRQRDTDGDGISDGFEVLHMGSNPLSVDSDSDGITDWDEFLFNLDPNMKWDEKRWASKGGKVVEGRPPE